MTGPRGTRAAMKKSGVFEGVRLKHTPQMGPSDDFNTVAEGAAQDFRA
jgi:hypothetical protein